MFEFPLFWVLSLVVCLRRQVLVMNWVFYLFLDDRSSHKGNFWVVVLLCSILEVVCMSGAPWVPALCLAKDGLALWAAGRATGGALRWTGRAEALLPYLVVKQMWVTKSRMGGNGVLQESNAETHAFRLPVVMLRDKGSLFLGYPGAVPLLWAELVWAMSNAGKPVLFLWQWCTRENSAEMMTHRSMCVCTCGWFCVRNWRAAWFILGWVCEEICGVAESCAFSTGQTSDKKRVCLLSLFALFLQDIWR